MFGKGTPPPLLESGKNTPQKVTFLGNSHTITRLQGIEPLKNVPIHLVKGRLTKGHRFGKKKWGRFVACDMPESNRKNTRSLTIRRKTWGMPLTSADVSLFGGKRSSKGSVGAIRDHFHPNELHMYSTYHDCITKFIAYFPLVHHGEEEVVRPNIDWILPAPFSI